MFFRIPLFELSQALEDDLYPIKKKGEKWKDAPSRQSSRKSSKRIKSTFTRAVQPPLVFPVFGSSSTSIPSLIQYFVHSYPPVLSASSAFLPLNHSYFRHQQTNTLLTSEVLLVLLLSSSQSSLLYPFPSSLSPFLPSFIAALFLTLTQPLLSSRVLSSLLHFPSSSLLSTSLLVMSCWHLVFLVFFITVFLSLFCLLFFFFLLVVHLTESANIVIFWEGVGLSFVMIFF